MQLQIMVRLNCVQCAAWTSNAVHVCDQHQLLLNQNMNTLKFLSMANQIWQKVWVSLLSVVKTQYGIIGIAKVVNKSIFVCVFLVDDHIQEQLEAAKPEPVVEEVDLVNLAPRKPDW